mgnify:CR=1 FL=1
MEINIKGNIFISDKEPELIENLIYNGHPLDASDEFWDSLLISGDSSYNPLRPFRWYRNFQHGDKSGVQGIGYMAFTDEPKSIEENRRKSIMSYLRNLDIFGIDPNNPPSIWIYEKLTNNIPAAINTPPTNDK